MKSSLRQKLMIVLLAATILPLSISMLITYQRTTTSISEQVIKDNAKLMFQGKSNLLNYFNLIHKLSFSVYYDANAGDTLFRLMRDGISRQGNDNYERSVVGATLRSMMMTGLDIKQIRLHMNRDHRAYLLVNEMLRFESNVHSPQDDTVLWRPDGYIEHSHPSHTYGINQQKFSFYFSETVLTYHRPIYDVPSDEEIGRLSIDFTLDYIRAITEMLYSHDLEEFWLINDNGDVVLSSDQSYIGEAAPDEDWVKLVLNSNDEQGHFKLKTDDFDGIVIYEHMHEKYMNWAMVKRIPYDHLYSDARQITRINTIVLGCFLVITILANIYISYHITKPINRLIQSIHSMKGGNLHVEIPVNSRDEIGVLARRFRQLMDQINHLVLREYRLEIVNKTNQLKALQAQTNPHFLNNALQSIGTVALKHKNREVYSLISTLGKLMRYNMNVEETIVPLEKEIEHVSAYLALQKQRFGEQLNVIFQVDEDILQVELPKMIIQPLVENVFKHGVKHAEVPVTITIKCEYVEKNALGITVMDNGIGIDPAKLQSLQSQLITSEESILPSESIGLANILMRLKLFFNKDATITLYNNEEGGFTVFIYIPLLKGENEL